MTPREARVLVLLLEGPVSTRDIADVLGSSPGSVHAIRQTIRRKLAIPRNAASVVEQLPHLRTLANQRRDETAPPLPVAERRTNLVLRSAMRELDTAANRVRAKAAALASLADDAGADEHDAMLAEAAMVDVIAHELDEVRTRARTMARAGG